ncbi:MAG: Ig-like domain-containing protein, partial [Leucothrix sp.]
MRPIKKNKNTPLLAIPLLLSSTVLFAPQAFAAPTANPDNYTTTMGNSITISPLSNDRADIGTTFFIEKVDSPAPYGTGSSELIDDEDDDKIVYTPPANFTGTTTFWYGIKDSEGLITSAPIT